MREVIIHAGLHKTATTSIQKTCSKNRNKLIKSGIYYPVLNIENRHVINHSLPFHSLFSNNIQSDKKQKALHSSINLDNQKANEIYLEQIEQIFSQNHPKIIISGESISGLKPIELHKIKDKIESYNYHIRTIIFVRSPFSFMTSMVQERIKSDHYHNFANSKTIIDKIDNIISVFKDTEFYPFSESCKHEYGPVGFFLEKVGVTNYATFDFYRGNDSFSDEAIRLIAFINEKCHRYIDRTINPLRSFSDHKVFQKIQGRKFALNVDELNRFRKRINQENEYLLNKLGVEFCDRIPDTPKYQEDVQWSDEQLKQLKSVLPKVNDTIKAIIYNYCKNVIALDRAEISYVFDGKNPEIIANYQQDNLNITEEEYMSDNKSTVGKKAKVKEKAKVSFETGNQLQEQGNLEESIASYQQAIKIKPDYAQPLFKLAQIYESQENWGEATKCYRRVIGLKFDNHLAYLKLARVLAKQNKIYGAISAYQEAIELKSDLPGTVYKELGDLLLQDKSNVDTALAMYQQAADKKEDWSASFYIKYADTLLDRKLIDRAIVFYQKGIKLKNDVPKYYLALGDALGQKQELDKAVTCYQKAIQLKPDSVSAYKKLGDVYQAKEDYDSATGCYHKSLELKPEANYIYRSLGNVLSKQGNQEEAERYYSLSSK